MPIYRETYYSKTIQFKDRSTGQPVDISTWQFAASLKDETGEEVLALSTGAGHFTVFDGPNGWLRFALSVAETTALEAGPVSFALYRTDGANGTIRFGRGEDVVRDKD